jgi:hypothetical protein
VTLEDHASPIIPIDEHHKRRCLLVCSRSGNNGAIQTYPEPTTMIFHAINVVLLSAMTLYIVDSIYSLFDLVQAASIDSELFA